MTEETPHPAPLAVRTREGVGGRVVEVVGAVPHGVGRPGGAEPDVLGADLDDVGPFVAHLPIGGSEVDLRSGEIGKIRL